MLFIHSPSKIGIYLTNIESETKRVKKVQSLVTWCRRRHPHRPIFPEGPARNETGGPIAPSPSLEPSTDAPSFPRQPSEPGEGVVSGSRHCNAPPQGFPASTRAYPASYVFTVTGYHWPNPLCGSPPQGETQKEKPLAGMSSAHPEASEPA